MQRARVKKEREEEMVFIGMVCELKLHGILMHLPTVVGGEHYVFGLSVCLSVSPSINTCLI